MTIKSLITGFPRIGEKRELKKALESRWGNTSSEADLSITSSELRKKHWLEQKNSGIDLISINDFSWYDSMLDTAVMLSAVPERFKSISDKTAQYFAMARGTDTLSAMEMTKWFNTNYHYIVPELDDTMKFNLDPDKIVSEFNEARDLGILPKINIIGPLTFLGLSKRKDGGDCYDYTERILPVYRELIEKLSLLDNNIYLQMDEPVFVRDPSDKQLSLLKQTYNSLAGLRENVKIIVTTYFEHSNEATAILTDTPVWGIGLDFVHGPENLENISGLNKKKLIAGVVDGRNIWINNLRRSLDILNHISKKVSREDIIISTSCSLLHVPYSLRNESRINETGNIFSFAIEKVREVALLSNIFHADALTTENRETINNNSAIISGRASLHSDYNNRSGNESENNAIIERADKYEDRSPLQQKIFNLPPLPTTTIGSFPQTERIRKLRSDYKTGHITTDMYESGIKEYIDDCISFQEEIGIDVLVHGEAERNDMVEYFGELLEGFLFTDNGWVQSYGSRCVKPPVIYTDVRRPSPMTVRWIAYARSKTAKLVKGMLTGPLTILQWSFVRDDIPRQVVAGQIAEALRDEISDLQLAGINIIQVDEPAFKEAYPLRSKKVREYEKWAVNNFKLAVSSAGKETQIHTHMCYSEFNDIIESIESMDADVFTIETARSGNELLNVFRNTGYSRQVGPGVYDIHSPRVPPVDEFVLQIKSIMEVLPVKQLWINPDCGLKTRKWEEVKPALKNMVEAVRIVRKSLKNEE